MGGACCGALPQGKIGGDSGLSPRGQEYAKRLAAFISNQYPSRDAIAVRSYWRLMCDVRLVVTNRRACGVCAPGVDEYAEAHHQHSAAAGA